ncbi:hypothetical protein VTJ49DRAFT_1260 [Mycothermus thermophilus]|uniref:Uncharacterized protein n=1 Tax=Humicola insolens TaxID=85995 RepID=A0ABR3VDJ2_HUMIN
MEGSPPSTGPDTSGPKLIRPIPRRPFNIGGLSSPTPPEDSDDCASPRPQISASDLRFLAPHQRAATTPGADSGTGSTPLSHTTSYLNLTSGTLFGIYSPTTLGSFMPRNGEDEEGEYDAGTPGDFPSSLRYRDGFGEFDDVVEDDEEDDEEGEEDDYFGAATQPSDVVPTTQEGVISRPMRRRELVLQLTVRAALLFALGVGYGALVIRLPASGSHGLPQRLAGSNTGGAAINEPHATNWRYLLFWGAAGVALGSLLPWFDRFWEDRVAKGPSSTGAATDSVGFSSSVSNPVKPTSATQPSAVAITARRRRLTLTNANANTTSPPTSLPSETDAPVIEKPSTSSPPRADWALVIRGIGAFVGIVFAIRKLPWASTMQVSLTLALCCGRGGGVGGADGG